MARIAVAPPIGCLMERKQTILLAAVSAAAIAGMGFLISEDNKRKAIVRADNLAQAEELLELAANNEKPQRIALMRQLDGLRPLPNIGKTNRGPDLLGHRTAEQRCL